MGADSFEARLAALNAESQETQPPIRVLYMLVASITVMDASSQVHQGRCCTEDEFIAFARHVYRRLRSLRITSN